MFPVNVATSVNAANHQNASNVRHVQDLGCVGNPKSYLWCSDKMISMISDTVISILISIISSDKMKMIDDKIISRSVADKMIRYR